jgi:hypothetical protein
MIRTIAASTALLLLIAVSVTAGRLGKDTKRIEAHGAERVEVNIDFAMGEITIDSEDQSDVAVIELDYDPRQVDYDIEYVARNDQGFLDIESIQRRKRDLDSEDNLLGVTLSTRYPMELVLDAGACDAEFDFTGIPLTDLDMDIGAASGRIEFGRPNPVRLERFDVDAGASSVEFESLGNANFEVFNFSGGAGSFDLDLRGEYNGESRVMIDVGVGSADIIVPEDIPVRVEADRDGWLSSVDFHGDDLHQVEDDVYESEGFQDAQTRLIIEIDVGLGSVDLYWR